MRLELTDSRRLTGPNLLLPGAGAAIEVAVDGVDVDRVCASWLLAAGELLEAFGWTEAVVATRPHDGGAAMAFSAPIDVLYTACELNEAIWERACARLRGEDPLPIAEVRGRLAPGFEDEADPAWERLRQGAREHDVAFLWDDDEASVGLGAGSRTWPVGELPDPADVDWDAVHDVPVALVTGTNGKSTTVRMLATVLRTAGRSAGLTSTDGIHVGEELVESGDYSGPGGARTLLRHPAVEVGVLEVARGGMLRRGLPVERARVAAVTNISDDHLGEYGIDDLDDLARAKLVVAKAVAEDGLLLLNADDDRLVAHAPTATQRVAWWSMDPANGVLRAAVAAGERGWTVLDGRVVELDGDEATPVVAVADVPATVGGAARHNVANLLGVVALARSLGVEVEHVAAGVRAFRGDDTDNPGRANRFDVGGATVVVDFAHNPAGMRAILETAGAMPAERRLVLLGQAGDRSDRAIADLARTAWSIRPDRVIAIEIPDYLRGREPLEVPTMIRDVLVESGARPEDVEVVGDPLAGVRSALDWARPGDLLVLMVLDRRAAALDLIRERATAG